MPAAFIKQHGRWKTTASAALYVAEMGSAVDITVTRAVIAGVSFAEAMRGVSE